MLTSQETTKVCGRMSEVVSLIGSIVEGHIDAFIVDARNDTDRSASEFGAQLIKSAGRYGLLRTLGVVCGNGRVMRGLLGDV